ncbi:hypothetical protein N9137_00840 [Pseudomonadales bacterium]|nr:hypothetical protein [Pseudomonadales bacterium]
MAENDMDFVVFLFAMTWIVILGCSYVVGSAVIDSVIDNGCNYSEVVYSALVEYMQ